MSLRRWFKEKWVDVKTGKPCGRQKGEKRKGYPACRPSRRVSSKTPKTTKEMSSGEKTRFRKSKTSSRRINYNHKRRKMTHHNHENDRWHVAEELNGRLAMLGILAALGAYASTGQIIPGIF